MRRTRRSWEEQRRVDQQNWYDDMHTTQIKLKLNKRTDADILDWLWREAENRKWIAWLFLLLYLCCVVYITLLSRGDSLKRIFKADVFTSWRMWLEGNVAKGRSILQNIMLFVPMGFFLTQVLQGRRYRFPAAVLLGFAVSLLIETVQYHTGRGWFDAEDLFNNTLGAAIGSGLFCAADRIMGKGKAGRVACEVVSVLLILAGLIGCLQMKKMVGR